MTAPPLPGPSSPHRITRWGLAGRVHSACSCSPTVDPASPECQDYALARRLLADAWTLATARHAVKPRSWPDPEHPGPLTAAAQRQRGAALLGLVVAAGAGPQLEETGGASGSELHPGQEETPEPARQDGRREAIRAVSGVAPDATPAPRQSAPGTPARWYAPAWQRPPRCPVCRLHHYQRWSGGGHMRPCTKDDPVTDVYPVCPECGWTVDPVAVALFDGRHAVCSLPRAERLAWESDVREHGRRRRGQLTREETAA